MSAAVVERVKPSGAEVCICHCACRVEVEAERLGQRSIEKEKAPSTVCRGLKQHEKRDMRGTMTRSGLRSETSGSTS